MSDTLGRAAIVAVIWLIAWAVIAALGYTLTIRSLAGGVAGFILAEAIRAFSLRRQS